MYDDQHANAVRFLEEQNDPAFLKPVHDTVNMQDSVNIFEPCIIIGDRSKLFINNHVRIDSFTKLEIGKGMHIGRSVHIASFAHIGIGGGTTFIGDFCAVASGGKLISGSNQVDASSMSPLAPKGMYRIIRGVVSMNPYSCVLTNAVVYPGVTLGEGAVLMPNSTATKSIPAWEVWGGSPARFLFKRVVR